MPDQGELIGRVERYYSDRLAEGGATHLGVDWNSRESQFLRFDQLMRVAERAEEISINDYGCGYGALVDWLREDGRPFAYTGFDVSEAMVAEASRIYAGDDRVSFGSSLQAVEPADFTIASGIFNVKAGASDDEWLLHFHREIEVIAGLSRKGFAFNVLTGSSDPDRIEERLYYADPVATVEHVIERHSRWVALLQDYGLYEFTLVARLD